MADDVLVFHEEELTLQGDVLVFAKKTPVEIVDFDTKGEILEILTSGQIGPPGRDAVGGTFVWVQSAPAATWTIVHNFGTKPAVVLELASDPTELIYTDVSYPDLNTVVVEWSQPETGKVYI